MLIRSLLAAAGLLGTPGQVHAVLQSVGIPPFPRPAYPLNCRGGGQLVFDTIGSPTDTGTTLRLLLTFGANPSAAGAEGQGLHPSTCAWVDRPVHAEEPRQVRVTVPISDSTPRATVRDTGVYWSFLVHNSDSGHLTAVGYRHWHESSPPLRHEPQVAATTAKEGSWLPFDPSHLPWYVLGWVVITWVPLVTLVGLWSGWRRLAGLYPDRNTGRGRSIRAGMVMGRTRYRGGARLTADDSALHFSMGALLRAGHRPFSVPWSDITTTRDTWPWFPFKGHPVIRLALARDPSLRILVAVSDGERLVQASGGRLEPREPRIPQDTATGSRR